MPEFSELYSIIEQTLYNWRNKFYPKAEDSGSAPAPVRPLGKSSAGASLLAQSLVDKYADHLPTNRQQTRFARDGTRDYTDVLQTDGWEVYKSIADKIQGITLIFCMAHARRRFKEAEQYEEELVAFALSRFQVLYDRAAMQGTKF